MKNYSGTISLESVTTDDISYLFDSFLQVMVLRLDKIHPLISGNKLFKLRYYLEEAKAQKKKNIITFGGAWSNHILATAAACRMHGLHVTGIIRGEEPLVLSPTLQEAKKEGMQLVFVSREEYALKHIPAQLNITDSYIINEGGYGEPGARGAGTMLDLCTKDFTHYCCAAGTGTMTAGLVNAAKPGNHIVAISVLKNSFGLESMINTLITGKNDPSASWKLINDYHFGGYAKYQPALLRFMNDFYQQTDIPSDFVYTGKLFYAVMDLAKKGFFPQRSRLLLVHSGGLQGNHSLKKGTLLW
jgi:1-aminocyclopropane-1-carboxylate deaminase